MKLLELLIICLVFLLLSLAVCGCDKEPVTVMAQHDTEMEWWYEKDEDGTSPAERMAESTKRAEEQFAERKRQAE